jgi:hypothetical protein
VRMTRRQTRSYGVVTPSSRQPLLEAMLRAFAWLVSNVVSTCRTIFNRNTRDWHTDRAEEDQRPTPNDLTQEIFPAETTGLPTGSGPSAASPAQAGVQTPHEVRTRNPSALRALTGPPPSRGTRVDTCAQLSGVIPGEGATRRRPGTQELHAPAAQHVTGFRLTRFARVRNDTVGA